MLTRLRKNAVIYLFTWGFSKKGYRNALSRYGVKMTLQLLKYCSCPWDLPNVEAVRATAVKKRSDYEEACRCGSGRLQHA
jgi:hypothetical protein